MGAPKPEPGQWRDELRQGSNEGCLSNDSAAIVFFIDAPRVVDRAAERSALPCQSPGGLEFDDAGLHVHPECPPTKRGIVCKNSALAAPAIDR